MASAVVVVVGVGVSDEPGVTSSPSASRLSPPSSDLLDRRRRSQSRLADRATSASAEERPAGAVDDCAVSDHEIGAHRLANERPPPEGRSGVIQFCATCSPESAQAPAASRSSPPEVAEGRRPRDRGASRGTGAAARRGPPGKGGPDLTRQASLHRSVRPRELPARVGDDREADEGDPGLLAVSKR